jgi:glyoxylase-like metal-dependent hydrolase (beta-lactamase superfamily II)
VANMAPSFEVGSVRVYAGEKNGKYPDGNQVIVQGSKLRAVFDSPKVSNTIGEPFDQADLVIQGHVHEDHMAGLHRLTDVPVYVHSGDLHAIRSWEGMCDGYGYDEAASQELLQQVIKDYNYCPTPDAIPYEDGHSWDLGGGVTIRAIHAPGHTAGHTILLVEPEGVAFIGDIDLSGFGPYYGDATSNLTDFRKTLALLKDLPAKVWVTSHHRGVYTDAELFHRDLKTFTDKLELREQAILGMLEQGPLTLCDMVRQGILYPPGIDMAWRDFVERKSIIQHLDELQDKHMVNLNREGLYSLAL